MRLLRKTPTGKGHFFSTPKLLATHMETDPYMDTLRDRNDYKAFVASLTATKPLELAPAPQTAK